MYAKIYSFQIFFQILTVSFIFQGCSHTALDQKIDLELAQGKSIKTHQDLRAETDEVIESARGLTDDQRSRLSVLRESIRLQDEEMRMKSLKLRALLIKNIIASQYHPEEVDLIKKRIKDIEAKRLATAFNAIEKANIILGHETDTNRHPIMESFFDGHGFRD